MKRPFPEVLQSLKSTFSPTRRLVWVLLGFLIPGVAATAVRAQEPAIPLSISMEALGDREDEVVSRVTFRFSNPVEPDAGAEVFLQGSFIHSGRVLRNFRYRLPEEIGPSFSTIQTFPPGEVTVEVRLIMPLDEGAPVIIAKTAGTFAVARTDRPYVASEDDGAESILAEGVVPETVGAVKIRTPRRDVAPNLFVVHVDVLPPVRRVEFFVDGKRVVARNAPPYSAELDLGRTPKRVEVRAIGYDGQGRYVDADAFVVNERQTPLEVKITHTVTPDGLSRFRLSVQNPQGTKLESVELFAGDRKLHEWTRGPYALDIPTARLEGVEFVRASVIDETGYEASDLVFLSGDRYIERIDVNLVELPVSVTGPGGVSLVDLTQKNFTVYENGVQQAIASFNFAENLPISVGVLLDHSGSMEKRMAEARAAAAGFFKSIIRSGDRAFVAGFAADPARSAPFVSDVATLEAQVSAVADARGGTSLHDAIVTGLYRFRNVQGRKALIVITDGDDTTSRLSYDDVLSYSRAARVPVYFIGIGMSGGALGGGSRMRSLAAETGGLAVFIRNAQQLSEAYGTLERDLRSQYLIAYQSQSAKGDQEYRTVEVKVDRSDARVRTIRGYIP
jgi:Ca-activated chloride channel homolog